MAAPSVPCLIYSTHPTLEQARTTAALLLEESLAACCNILPQMESHYVWNEQTEHANEVVMLTKTMTDYADTVIELISSHHPYECPAILQIPIQGGAAPFLEWIHDSCAEL